MAKVHGMVNPWCTQKARRNTVEHLQFRNTESVLLTVSASFKRSEESQAHVRSSEVSAKGFLEFDRPNQMQAVAILCHSIRKRHYRVYTLRRVT